MTRPNVVKDLKWNKVSFIELWMELNHPVTDNFYLHQQITKKKTLELFISYNKWKW